jgi:class 3 adenylate cyclase/tetratricopeptide (TPR) repeat protein
MSAVRHWLDGIGLGQYADAFEANHLDMDLISQVDDNLLKDIGISSAGHRLRIRNAITKLSATNTPDPLVSAAQTITETPAPSAERRQLTVMFCDLVGSTELSTRLDPEDLRAIIGAYHRCCTELVERNGGFVAKYIGDGVLAYFSYPGAHEDDAERAIRAGLALTEAVPKLATNTEVPAQVRVGIATGLVIVGDLIGSGAAQEQAVVGETPNLAARLQSLAEPGTVVIASSTKGLTGGLFEYRDLGAVTLKGFAENVSAWQVLGVSAAESRFEALRSTTTPLVGRDEELDLLMRRWGQAKRGDGQVVLISGEPGIGKSRIAQAVQDRGGTEPHTRLRYFASPHHQDSALYPVISQLEREAGFRRDDTNEQRLTKLETILAQGTNDLSEAVPLLAELLSIPIGEGYPPLNLTPQKRKEKTLKALLTQVERLAAKQPVLMVFEDAHWIDPTSRESLDLIIDRVSALRVLVIVTFRPEFTPPWVGRPQVTLLTLNRLSPRQRAEMISGVVGGKTLPREIADQIIERTDGIPLFVEELTKAVLESGVVAEAGGHYQVTGQLTPLAIPTSLHASLLARLDRLAPVREVAQIAAALGRSFSHELISALSIVPVEQLDDALDQLVTAELIFRRGVPPDAEYTFKHALVQDAAYGTLLKSRRQQIHARIATTLEEKFPEMVASQSVLLAHHCTEAGLIEKAVGYWLKSGQQAVSRSAITEAEAQLQRGLDLLASFADSDWRRQQELELRIALGRALMAARGLAAPAVGENYARARVLAEQVGQPEYLVPVIYGQTVFHVFRAEWRLVQSLSEQMEEMAAGQNDVITKLLGLFHHGVARFNVGDLVSARALFDQCHSLFDPAHRSVYAALTEADALVGIVGWLAVTLSHLGHVDQGRARMMEALSEARRLERVYILGMALLFACRMEFTASAPQELQRYSHELQSLSSEHGFPLWFGWALIHRGRSLVALGQLLEGLSLVTEGLSAVRATGAILGTPAALVSLADAYARLGQLGEGQNCLAEAAQIIEVTEERVHEAQLHRLRGDLLNATGHRAAAEDSYHRALGIAKQQSAKVWELSAATSLARLWRDQGKRTEAHDLLALVYNWFTEGFDTPVLQEAKALLEQLTA